MQPPQQPAGGQPEHGSPYAGYEIQPAYQAPYAPSGYQVPPAPAYAAPPQPSMYPPPHQTPYAHGHQGYYPPPQNWLPPALTDPGHWNPDNPEVGRAEMGVRFVARMVDTFVVGCVWYAMMVLGVIASVIIGGGEMDGGGPGEIAFMVTTVFNFFLLSIVLEALQVRLWGRSVGKILLGLWVVRSDGSGRVELGRAFVRALLYSPGMNPVNWILPWSITNVLWPLRDKRTRKCLHDKAAGTVVVQVRR